jgi:catechol 2,3-dioxygenase-like lactoylglutathione lyase family enzyme
MVHITALDHLVLTVSDMDRTVRFYVDVLGMTAHSFAGTDGTVRQALSFGAQKINLHPADAVFAPHADRPTPGSADLCLLTDSPLPEWEAHLKALSIPIEDGPVRRTGATGPILSIYLRDPDGNLIEVSAPIAP